MNFLSHIVDVKGVYEKHMGNAFKKQHHACQLVVSGIVAQFHSNEYQTQTFSST